MDTNKNIDQFVKQKLEKRTFEFQNDYWETTEQMIVADENRRRKRRGFFLWVLGVSVCIAGSGGWFFSSALTRSQTKFTIQHTPSNIQHNHENTVFEQVELTNSFQGNVQMISITQDETSKPIDKIEGENIEGFTSQVLNIAFRDQQNNDNQEVIGDSSYGQVYVEVEKEHRRKSIIISPIEMGFSPKLNTLVPPADVRKLNVPFKKYHWNLILGGQLWNPIRTPNGLTATEVPDLFGGMIYEREINSRLSLNTGILYQSRSGLNTMQEATFTDYSFGVETITTQLIAQRVHAISLPLYVRMQLMGRHTAILGMNYSSIVQVSGEKLIKKESSLGEIIRTKEKVNALVHNFNQNDLALRAGYEYHLYHKTFLGIQVNYGLKNIYKKEVGLKERNLAFQFYVRYHLFSH